MSSNPPDGLRQRATGAFVFAAVLAIAATVITATGAFGGQHGDIVGVCFLSAGILVVEGVRFRRAYRASLENAKAPQP